MLTRSKYASGRGFIADLVVFLFGAFWLLNGSSSHPSSLAVAAFVLYVGAAVTLDRLWFRHL
jgi:hypothetical protein